METTTPSAGAQVRSPWRRLLGPTLTVWVGLAVLAITNGILREALLAPALGDGAAHVLSTLLLAAAVATVAALFVRRFAHEADRRTLLSIGGLWTVLTLAFEFGFGRYVVGKSWAVLLADYDVLAGRIWVLVPLTLLVAPLVAARYVERR